MFLVCMAMTGPISSFHPLCVILYSSKGVSSPSALKNGRISSVMGFALTRFIFSVADNKKPVVAGSLSDDLFEIVAVC